MQSPCEAEGALACFRGSNEAVVLPVSLGDRAGQYRTL